MDSNQSRKGASFLFVYEILYFGKKFIGEQLPARKACQIKQWAARLHDKVMDSVLLCTSLDFVAYTTEAPDLLQQKLAMNLVIPDFWQLITHFRESFFEVSRLLC